MDESGERSHYAPAGVSIRNGPVLEDKMEVDGPTTNGNAKRKGRASIGKAVNYNVDGTESEEDAVPLVCTSASNSYFNPNGSPR